MIIIGIELNTIPTSVDNITVKKYQCRYRLTKKQTFFHLVFIKLYEKLEN